MNQLRIAIIGSGARATSFAQNLKKRDDAKVTAVVDINQLRLDTFCENFGFNDVIKANDYHEIIDNIDAAIVTTPDFAHTDIVIDLLNAGKDVFCEKPMAVTVEDCKRMVEARMRSGKLLFVGFVLRFTWFSAP